MERSDWSCAYCHQGAPRENTLLSFKCADFGPLSDWSRAVSPPGGVNCIVGSDWSRAVTWPMMSQLICINLHKLHPFAVKLSPESATIVSTVLMRSHVIYDVTHVLRACCASEPVFVLLPCCFAMIRLPKGAATSQMCRRFWWVEIRHVT